VTEARPDYRTEPLVRYLEDAAAAEATPGGVSVAAMAGALASTMASMAAGFTAGREKFKDVEEEIQDALRRLDGTRDRFLDLVHGDMEAYEGIMAACGCRRGSTPRRPPGRTRRRKSRDCGNPGSGQQGRWNQHECSSAKCLHPTDRRSTLWIASLPPC
jgi:hypothetical protein